MSSENLDNSTTVFCKKIIMCFWWQIINLRRDGDRWKREKFKKLFWEIFNCNGEKELYKIVISNDLLKNPNNWYPYGGKSKNDRSNFATFENQQPNPVSALVEKITNSIDALLLKKCKQKNIDPKSQKAPRTMEDATEEFFDIPKGDIGELLGNQRTKLARDNIQITATGGKGSPDLMIWDNGEGQRPDDFKDTFLSIANNNKTDIAFVQGKYNMGSTGAVVFCGEYRYQLIASKKDQDIFNKENNSKKNLFGWTLVRRHILTTEENSKYGSSWYEYFAINGETIPQFQIDNLDIGLADNKKFTTGSFIKLFSYEMPKGTKGAIHADLYRELNQLLYKPALPVWLWEKRENYKELQILNIAVHGNHVRINDPDNESLENKPMYEKVEDKEIGEFKILSIVFKKGENKPQQTNRRRHFIGKGRNVIYILNGQVQGMEGQSFITQDLKFNFLKDSMLVVIDCSKIKTQFRQDLFMANRSNLRESRKLEALRNKVIEVLKGNENLKKLNTKRKNAILQGGDDKKEKELIENLLSKVPLDKSLTNLLKRGSDLVKLNTKQNQKQTTNKVKEEKRPKETKRFPSIFKINLREDKKTGKKVKSIPLNGKGIIQFETDVAEDYFYRPQEKGEFQIKVLEGKRENNPNPNPKPSPYPNDVKDIFEVNQSGPSGGSIKLTLKPQQDLSVGDEIKLNARLTSPDGDKEILFYVKIVDPQKQETKKVDKEPEKPDLPKLIKITKKNEKWQQDNNETWNEVEDWDENHIIHVIPADEDGKNIVDAIAINMDSYSLKNFISENGAKSEEQIELLRNQYIGKVYSHGLFLYSILDKLKNSEQNNKYSDNNKSSEDWIAEIFKSYGNVLLYLDTNKEILNSLDE